MAKFQIVVTQQDYKILDVDGSRLIAEGISSYMRALIVYERLLSLQEGAQFGTSLDGPGL